jgi:ABC-type multidrug transport system ATPase subunit
MIMDQQKDKVGTRITESLNVPGDPQVSSRAEVCIQAEHLTLRLNAAPRRWKQRLVEALTNPGGHGDTAGHERVILDDVSISFRKGTLTAILGGSGSGKSSLLSVLGDRSRPKEMSVSGDIIYNGNPNIRSIDIAYLVQNDVLPETLTVGETLDYSAELRRPFDNADARKVVVQSLLQRLHLVACADTRLGGEQCKGCSGGERRRTSIGIQLLSDAEILLCDEPTTGMRRQYTLCFRF